MTGVLSVPRAKSGDYAVGIIEGTFNVATYSEYLFDDPLTSIQDDPDVALAFIDRWVGFVMFPDQLMMELPYYLSLILTIPLFMPYSLCSETHLTFSNETDRISLLAFKQGINPDPLGILTSWNDSIHFCVNNGGIEEDMSSEGQEYLVSVLKIGVVCSSESPIERMDMGNIVTELSLIRDAYHGVGFHGERRNTSPLESEEAGLIRQISMSGVVGNIHFYLYNNGHALPLSQTNQSQEYPEVITLDIDEGPALPTQPEVASPIIDVDPPIPNVGNVKRSTNVLTVKPKSKDKALIESKKKPTIEAKKIRAKRKEKCTSSVAPKPKKVRVSKLL
ncbi:hypothetical protein GIB67_027445 [Kingdonia uniflora]|uniref:Leucine-rich repeat-containing N-terminal plant-type domain-containing protein n=1 Tax=Kingdonia uniflora TaxID=39325 RepID=A0A7J7MFS4_9MAGN|nr:hypothetical protein GIB67_027445 [Kingdonia uniflora]